MVGIFVNSVVIVSKVSCRIMLLLFYMTYYEYIISVMQVNNLSYKVIYLDRYQYIIDKSRHEYQELSSNPYFLRHIE